MLTLFNNITEKLTDLEKERLLPMLIEILKDTNEGRRITGRALSDWYIDAGFVSMSETRIRKLVNYIRQLNLISPYVLIGSGSGYFITNKIAVVDKQIESLMGRIESQMAVVDAIRAQRENLKRNTK